MIMKDSYMLKCLTVIGIVLLEAIALLKGVDGVYFGSVMAILGVALGVKYKEEIIRSIEKFKNRNKRVILDV